MNVVAVFGTRILANANVNFMASYGEYVGKVVHEFAMHIIGNSNEVARV